MTNGRIWGGGSHGSFVYVRTCGLFGLNYYSLTTYAVTEGCHVRGKTEGIRPRKAHLSLR